MTPVDLAVLEALAHQLGAEARGDAGRPGPDDGADASPRDLAGTEPSGALGERDQRRARGAFFTPVPLADFVVHQVLAPLAAQAPRRLTVLDPACGDGRFLAAVAAWVARQLPSVPLHLLGIERDATTAALARRQLAARIGATAATVDIRESEALLGVGALGPVDAVVGNPPYVRSIHLRTHDPALWAALRGRFAATSHGEWDLYAPFIERSLQWVRGRGRVGLVVPSRWLTAAFARDLRATVAASVSAIIDLGALQIFPGATTYASVVLLEAERARAASRFARLTRRGWVSGELALTERAGAPWILRAGPGHLELGRAGPTLGDVAQIAKGCGTNADRVFVVRGRLLGDELHGQDGFGGAVCLEAAALRPCLRGRDVEAPPATDQLRDYCLLPYQLEGTTGAPALRPWHELVEAWPKVAAYLQHHRAALEARERGRFRGPTFYQLGRPQNLRFLLAAEPKVVIPDVALRGRAVLDEGSLVLDSAYALRPHLEAPPRWRSATLLVALLRSPAVRLWLDMVGVPLRGGYFRMKTAFLTPMPLPPEGEALAACAAAAARGDLAAADEALRQAYDVDAATWQRAR